MGSLFAPADAIISRFSYPRKMILTAILFIVPISYLIWLNFSYLEKHIAQMGKEREGLAYIQTARAVFELAPQHRGLSQGILNGNDKARPKLRAVQQKLTTALQQLAEVDERLGSTLKTGSQVGSLTSQAQALMSDGLSLTPAESFKRHTRMIMGLHQLIGYVANESGLSIDPDLGSALTSRAMVDDLLMAAEYAGRTRGLGTGIAAKGEFTPKTFTKLSINANALSDYRSALALKLDHIELKRPDLYAELGDKGAQTVQALDKFLGFVRERMLEPEAIQARPDEVFQNGTRTITHIFDLFDTSSVLLSADIEHRIGLYRNREITALGLTGLCLLLMAYMGIGFYRTVTRGISAINEGADQVAKGNLQTHVQVGTHDEMLQVQDSLNHMVDTVKTLITNVVSSTNLVVRESGHIANTTEQTRAAMDSQQVQVSQVATAVNEMAATVQEVARSATQTAESTAAASTLVSRSREIVNDNVSAIGSLAEEIEHASGVVAKVESDSIEIGTVLDVIRSIAEQTNLLALNAAIEAARAGEQGRGFAVVADEVRSLAARTQQSTEEIQGMIERLQSGTKQAVEVMQDSQDKAHNGVQEARKTNDALTEITEAIKRIADMSSQIASAAEEQNVATEEINQSVVSINDSSQATFELSNEAASASETLSHSAQELMEATSRFRL